MRVDGNELEYCVYCDDFRSYRVEVDEEMIQVKDLLIRCKHHRAYCSSCGRPIYVKAISLEDHMEEFETYKRIKGLVDAQELIAFRKAIGYSAVKLSRALGLGDKTITRLENGDIQSASVDMLLKLAMGKVKPLGQYKKEKKHIRSEAIDQQSNPRERKNP